ncbi:MAG: AlpA family phage regulatory protein [Alphaproteobacteria bacterium]
MITDDMLDAKAACAFLGGSRPIHVSTFYRGIAQGRFPRPIAIGPNVKRWRRAELAAVIEAAAAARESA